MLVVRKNIIRYKLILWKFSPYTYKTNQKFYLFFKAKLKLKISFFLSKIIRKGEGSNFFSYYTIKMEYEFLRRTRFDGLFLKVLKNLNHIFICLKYDLNFDPYYIFLKHLNCLSSPVYLFKKWSKKSYVPLDKMYQLRRAIRVRSLFRSCRIFLTLLKKRKWVIKFNLLLYKEFSSLPLKFMSDSLINIDKNLYATFANRRNLFMLY